MKRCIICGNLGDDNSTVCEVCGNPYMDLDDDAPDRMEAGGDPVTEPEPDISEDWEPEPETPGGGRSGKRRMRYLRRKR